MLDDKKAKYLIHLLDVEGWTLSAVKAECKKISGLVIKARSKDMMVYELLKFT